MENGTPRHNLEIKATVRDKSAFRRAAESVATECLGIQLQTDTYFACDNGRLKLREIAFEDGTSHAQLIHYSRTDAEEAKSSNYRIAPVTEPSPLKETLASAFGIWKTVRKRREIFLHKNVRIHLDEVEGLGDFMEIEAVQEAGMDLPQQRELVRWLSDELGIAPEDRLAGSYSDMLAVE